MDTMAFFAVLNLGLPALVTIGFAVYLISATVYRLLFHPLRRIPGPRLAATTHLYEIYYDVWEPGQYNFKIVELHKKYGPILRINPDEVHVADPEFLSEIYGARKRDRLYEPSLDTADSVAGTTGHEQHKKRRQAMVNFFSPPAVRQLEPLLAKKRDVLSEVIEKSLKSDGSSGDGPVLNLSDLFFAYFYDIIFEYAFAIDSNLMLDPVGASSKRQNSTNLLMQVNWTRHFGWINDLVRFLPRRYQRAVTPPGVSDLAELAVQVRENVNEVLEDEKTDSSATTHKSIFYTIRDDATLPESEKHPLRLQREGWFLVVAGSDTPSRVLAITQFHILNNPGVLKKLREELRGLGPYPSLAELENNTPYLNAIITEGARLGFGLSRRNSRVAPDEALVYNGYKIPPGFPVSTSTLSIHADDSIFPDPWAFKPKRWLGPEAAEKRKFLGSFGFKGPRSCLGKSLAEATLRLAIAAVVQFDLELWETTVRDFQYLHDFQMCQGDLKSQGLRVAVKGKQR